MRPPVQQRAYCPACNAAYDAARSGRCPRCGVSEAAGRLAVTRMMAADRTDTIGPEGFDSEDLVHLVGSRLHVYRLDEFLGKGGMGTVFLGWHEPLHRKCAVKVLLPKARS